MATEIAPIPLPVPREIIDAAVEERLVVFIGAGVSRLAGSLGWDQLARNLVEESYNTLRSSGERCISFRERETLLAEENHKKTITICYEILRKNGYEDRFYSQFDRVLEGHRPSSDSANIYGELARLPAVFVTTNADTHFGCDRYFRSERILYETVDFRLPQIEPRKLYHIHGVRTHRESLIFTVDRYISQYNNPEFVAFMKHLFSNYVILFIGYGLGEFELLDFLFTKCDGRQQGSEPAEMRHFALLPYFRDDVNILEFDQSYYQHLRIKVLGYQKDANGYEQLYEVVKAWSREILQVSPILPRTIAEIDHFIASPSDDRLSRLLQAIRHDDASRAHFFREVTKLGNPVLLLQALRGEGYFNPMNNHAPQEDPKQKGYFSISGWQVLPYLESVAEYNQRQPSEGGTDTLLDIINEIAQDERNRENRNRNYYTETSVTRMIACLPPGAVTPEHIEFVRMFLGNPWYTDLVGVEIGDKLIPRLAERAEQDLLVRVLDVILSSEKRNDEHTGLIDGYWLAEILGKRGAQIIDVCGIESLRTLVRKIRAVVNSDRSEFSSVWIRTIQGPSEQHAMHRYENVIIDFARMVLTKLNPTALLDDVKALLEEEHPIFWRLGFYAINSHYDELKSLLWGFDGNPLDKRLAKPEIYQLLASHCKLFSPEEVGQAITWIESSTYPLPQEIQAEPDKVKWLAYRKKEWLSALLEAGDNRVSRTFAEYDSIAPGEIKHPGHDFWSESRSDRPASKLDWGALTARPNEELTRALNEYRGGDGWYEATREDVAAEFAKQIAENPVRFVERITGLGDLDDIFKLSMLSALRDAWNGGKDYKWDSLLTFVHELIRSKAVTEGDCGEQYVRALAGLIRSGTAQDSHAFDAALLPMAGDILLRAVSVPVSDISENADLTSAVINSTKYDVLSALLSYALRFARVGNSEDADKWPTAVKDEFTKRLDRTAESSRAYSFFLGEHLTNLAYLDRDWVYTNLDRIFPSDPPHWVAAFTGYLIGTQSVYEEFYRALRSAGHYHTAASTDFKETHVNDRVTDHICVGYLRGDEDLSNGDSLISTILKQKRIDQLDEIIDAFWRWRGESGNFRDKVKPLWKQLHEILSAQKDNAEFRKALANLHRWLSIVATIDNDVRDWVLASVDCLDHSWDAHLLVQYLAAHVQTSPGEVGEIYLHMIGKDLYPDYKKESIVSIVEGLYQNACEEQANRICNSYLAKGYEFLRDA